MCHHVGRTRQVPFGQCEPGAISHKSKWEKHYPFSSAFDGVNRPAHTPFKIIHSGMAVLHQGLSETLQTLTLRRMILHILDSSWLLLSHDSYTYLTRRSWNVPRCNLHCNVARGVPRLSYRIIVFLSIHPAVCHRNFQPMYT
jgi:hypothetical protein